MNKAFYIVGIVLSIVFIFLTAYYAAEVSSARFFSYYSDDYSYASGLFSDSPDKLTSEASLWSLLFFLAFLTIVLLGLIKIKTVTNKVLSIIGLSVTGIFLLWNIAVMSSPGSMSFDEVSPAWVLYSLIVLAFSIVGLVQSVRYSRRSVSGASENKSVGDLLDN